MERLTAMLAAAMLVTAGLPAAAAVTGQTGESAPQPGAQFAGAVGVQGAEVRGELEGRALEERLAAADSNASRASVVAAETERAEEQLADLRERRSTLGERYENGTVSESEYRARLAGIAAESRALERRLNETSEAARGLPPEVARERGVNASAVEALRDDAGALTDDEAADAIRGVAGEDAGRGLGGPPDNRGGPPERGDDDDDARGPPGDGSTEEDARNSTADGGDDGTGNASERGEERTDDRGNVTDDRAGDDGAGGNGSNGGADGNDDRGDGADDAEDDADDDESTPTATDG